MLIPLLKTMRPRQWTKNAFVFFALVFDKQMLQWVPLVRTLAGFGLFCLISSAVYIFNDLVDIESDRRHPEKKNRPLASGQLSQGVACGAASLPGGACSSRSAGCSPRSLRSYSPIYFLLNLAYSRWLKHIPIVDVMIVAAGFVLRVHSGTTLIVVERFSPWLYVVTTLGALYLGFGKRRSELALLAQGAGSHRKVLDGYTLPLLDQYITIVSAATILAYSLYTFSAPNLPENHSMMLTIPFMAYIIFRYLYLIHVTHNAGAPEEVLLSDRPMQIAILLLGLAVVAVFYWP